jgi:hypothetical protein
MKQAYVELKIRCREGLLCTSRLGMMRQSRGEEWADGLKRQILTS